MPKMTMNIPHHLLQEEALKRAKTVLEGAKKEFVGKIDELNEEWDGNTGEFTLSVMGFSISGKLTVSPSEIKLSADLPFAARFVPGKVEEIKEIIRKRAYEALA